LVSAPGVSVRESVPTVQAGEGAKAGDARPDDGPTQSVVALPAVGVLAAPGADAPDAGTQGDRAPLGNHTLATLASSHGRPGASGPEVIADPSLAPGSHPSSGALDQSVTDAALAPAPSASAATAPLSAGTPVTLAQLPQTVSLAIQLGNSGAASIVRIRLTPPELGGIRVSITQTADGLVARVLADHAGAAQTLAQSGDELRRSLANAGVSLLRLDIGASGEQSLGERGGAPGAKEQSRTGEPALLEQSDSATAPPRTIALSNGVLVDILA
jgi:flagellar hook-length control protein FliK